MGIIAEHIKKLYHNELIENYDYHDYLLKEEEYLNSGKYDDDKHYWLSLYDSQKEINFFSEKPANNYHALRKSLDYSREFTAKIKSFCKVNNMSEFALFLSVISTYYYRITGKKQFYLGTPILNRRGKKEKNTIGAYINTIPIAVKIQESDDFIKLAKNITSQVMSCFRRQKFLYSEFLKVLRTDKNVNIPLFDVLVSFQNTKINYEEANWYHHRMQAESLQIHIADWGSKGEYHINYDYMTDRFTDKEIIALHGHLKGLITSILNSEQTLLASLNYLTGEEYQKVVYDFNNTKVPYERDRCIHELFSENVVKHPERTAVIFEDKNYTYRQIDEMSNSLAVILRDNGIGQEDIVAIIAKRSYKIIVAQFAVLKAGGAYMPIDPSYPKERINYMLQDSKCKIALVLEAEACVDVVIDMSEDQIFENTGLVNNLNSAKDICYCIYTSGSTGKPKGTLLTHRNVNNYCHNNRNNIVETVMSKNNCHSIVSTTTIGFDIYVTESILPLLNGLTVVYANENQANNQAELNKLICRYKVDVIQTTPTKLMVLMADWDELQYMSVLKAIIVRGESLESNVVNKIREYSDTPIYNIYGPTETTVWSTCAKVHSVNNIIIGRPIANTQIYILDNKYNPMPVGCVGELCIAGDGVGKGYLNNPQLTEEKFVINPFGKGRMYKTGDLARWQEDGNIKYIGRNDFQVKIRGLRIEPGEIENAMDNYQGVEQVIVTERKDEFGRQYICAYYVGEEIDMKVLKKELIKKLPQYMIPHYLIRLDKFPITSSGKIDRSKFPDPDFCTPSSGIKSAIPSTENERSLAKVLEEVLNIPRVGVSDNFFDIGGDSLKAIEYVSKLNKAGLTVSLQNIFDYPSIKELCDFIECGKEISREQSFDYCTQYNEMLHKNRGNIEATSEGEALGNVLITGVTGYIGAHLLYEFLENESGKAYCIVRSKNMGDAYERIKNLLEFYFEGKYVDIIGQRIVIISGDLTDKGLLDQINDKIHTILHAAASVKHYGTFDYFYENNVRTTEYLLLYAERIKAKFIHISTLSISGDSLFEQYGFIREPEEKIFTEADYYIGQNLSNVYVRTKFNAEELVLKSIQRGLKACIIRMGVIGNRSYDGRFQVNFEDNAFVNRVKFFMDIKCIPNYLDHLQVDLLPVDYCAKATILIAQHINDGYFVFHCNYMMLIYL